MSILETRKVGKGQEGRNERSNERANERANERRTVVKMKMKVKVKKTTKSKKRKKKTGRVAKSMKLVHSPLLSFLPSSLEINPRTGIFFVCLFVCFVADSHSLVSPFPFSLFPFSLLFATKQLSSPAHHCRDEQRGQPSHSFFCRLFLVPFVPFVSFVRNLSVESQNKKGSKRARRTM